MGLSRTIVIFSEIPISKFPSYQRLKNIPSVLDRAEDLEQNDLAANTQGQTPLDIAGDKRSRQMFLNPIEAIKSYISSVTKGDICAGMISYLHDKTKIKWHVTSLRHVQHLLRYFGSTSDVKGALNHPRIVFGRLPIMCAVCGGASLQVVAYMLEQNLIT